MYNEEDLASAVRAGVFSEDSVTRFRDMVARQNSTISVDEENFHLISSFNDIFVTIASCLLLVSVAWLGSAINSRVSGILFAGVSWGLAEFFVLKRHMALPAIVLLLTFIAGICSFALSLFPEGGSWVSTALAGVMGSAAAILHWQRFKVPITVAVGMATSVGAITAILVMHLPRAEQWLPMLMLVSGLVVFATALYWDARDRLRQTRQADVAFWLHVLSAPMIVYAIVHMLGLLDGDYSTLQIAGVIVLYLALAIVSIAIDRRALMVSALAYVLYAVTTLFEKYGVEYLGFAAAGLLIGSGLLLLSASWHTVRDHVLGRLPASLFQYLPPLR